jgi:hypothetical protein
VQCSDVREPRRRWTDLAKLRVEDAVGVALVILVALDGILHRVPPDLGQSVSLDDDLD